MKKIYLIIPIYILSIIIFLIATVAICLNTSKNEGNKKEASSQICAKGDCNRICQGDSQYCIDHFYMDELYNSNDDDYNNYDDTFDYSNNYSDYSKNYSSGNSYNPYPNNPSNYSDYEDFYYDNEEDFDDIDDAEDYYDEYGGD